MGRKERKIGKGKCSFDGCDNDVHACGLCRTHYGRKWRGAPLDMESRPDKKITNLQIAIDKESSIMRELHEAQEIYSRATGLETRMKWRGKIRELEHAIAELKPKLESMASTG